jgi:hypothetical protein
LYGWGWNGLGQLGHPPEEFGIQPTPFPFEFGDGNVQKVHCAGNSTFVLIDEQQHIFGEFGEFYKKIFLFHIFQILHFSIQFLNFKQI